MEIRILDFGTTIAEAERLRAIAARAEETLPIMLRIVKDMYRIEGIMFQSRGRRGGGSWARLKEDTVRKKGTTRILFTAGSFESYKALKGPNILFDSVSKPNARFNVAAVTKDAIEFGTSRPYASVHQEGSAKRNIPARPFLTFLPEDRRRWDNMIMRYLVEPHMVRNVRRI